MSLDAIFGLCRKKSSGVSVRPPLNQGKFFEDQQTVDNFVAAYPSQSNVPVQVW